ncbi:hypothetical protein NUW58_g3378 [Xylaria curta]|uniref:Uncharacterized protein n=1 Tax=Xylaria curta TaxID=42375 RepID=A0ACC1PB88_9PEZI|nr:hypothetical protein NUW58_g3378 [Xylaria curta]
MDEGERLAMLAQPALEPPDGVEPNFTHPSNMNAVANGDPHRRPHPHLSRHSVLVISGFASYVGFAYCLLRISQLEIGWWVHQWDVTWTYVAGVLYNSATAPVKVAILTEWTRIFSPRPRNAFCWLCQAVLYLNVAYYLVAIIVESRQCTPRERIWDRTVQGTCLDTKALEVLSSINVVSDVVLLIIPQFVIWRLGAPTRKKAGMTLIFAVGLLHSGTISAILRLTATQEHSKTEDSTYSAAPVYFWALSELTSIFIVYGLPAVPTAFAGAATRFFHYYTQWTQASSMGRTGDGPNASNIVPWREGRTGPSKRYKNLDRNSLPVNTLDSTTTQCTSTTVIGSDLSTSPESMCVVKTIEIRRDEVRTDARGDMDKEIGEEVLLRQHPWAKLGQG